MPSARRYPSIIGMNKVINGPLVVLYSPNGPLYQTTQVVVLPNGLSIMVFSGMKKGLVKVGMYHEDVNVKLSSGCNMGINHLISGPLVVL